MFNSDLDREGPANIGRRIFLTGAAAAAIVGLVFWQWSEPHVLQAAAADANEPKEVTGRPFFRFWAAVEQGHRRQSRQDCNRMAQTTPFRSLRHHAQLPTLRLLFPASIGTCTTTDSTAASVVTTRSLILLPNSTRALAGLVSGRLLRLRMCARPATQLSAWFVSRFLVPNAMPI